MYESNEAILKKATLGNDWALEKMIEKELEKQDDEEK